MAFDNNTYIDKSLNIGSSYKRGYTFPLDCTELFLSLEDAEKYALGDPKKPDERNLYKRAYAGQMIGVKTGTLETDETKGAYDIYIIQGDGTLKKVGDTEYHPSSELEEAKTVQIGGVHGGLTGSSLEGKPISEIIDLLLFPTYIPVYYDGYIDFNLLYKDNKNQNNQAFKIGSNIDLNDSDCVIKVVDKTYNSPYTVAGSDNANKATASNASESWSETPDSSTIGIKSYTLTVEYSDGIVPIKNSKGQNVTNAEYSDNFTTLVGNGIPADVDKFKPVYIQNEDETEEVDMYVIPACTLSKTQSIQIVYPYYIPNSLDKDGNMTETEIILYGINIPVSICRKYNAEKNKTMMYIDLPNTVNEETIEIRMKLFGSQGNSDSDYSDPLELLSKVEVKKNINGKEYTYYRYQVDKSKFGDTENGEADYKISFIAPLN
jgi:hypothetical protein